LRTALTVGETRFARLAAVNWLSSYPGDLTVGLLHAQALIREGGHGQTKSKEAVSRNASIAKALPVLEGLCQTDPEFIEAQEMYLHALKTAGLDESSVALASVAALGGVLDPAISIPEWGSMLRQARKALARGYPAGLETAERLVHQVLLTNPPSPLAALTHMQIDMQRGLPGGAVRSLAELYHERWPNCLHFSLILADSLMDGGESDRAVALLHHAVALDVSGQVPMRLWGAGHPYRALWPERIEAPMTMAVPAGVAAALGWNRLPSGKENQPETQQNANEAKPAIPADPTGIPGDATVPMKTQPVGVSRPSKSTGHTTRPTYLRPHLPEALQSVQAELERVAERLKKPDLAKADGRFPVYVIFTTHRGLEAQFGLQNTALLDDAVRKLAESIRAHQDWDAIVYYADEGYKSQPKRGAAGFEIQPAKPTDPWALKLALADLDTALGKRGEMIGAVLIVGGPEVVPFHHLPNPVDDTDVDVPSDNPYATRDENYFIPEWPVGRLASGCSSEAEPFLKILNDITNRHQRHAKPTPWFISIWERLAERFLPSAARLRHSLGYSAAIWKKASLSVFRPIGEANALLISPPFISRNGSSHRTGSPQKGKKGFPANAADESACVNLQPAKLGYFNLHGLEDAVEWYGQSDPVETPGGPDYPVALRPHDLECGTNGSRAPQVVFSEACFGAHILGKSLDEAMALKFIASGSQAVVGSTCVAYGSLASPLAAADLLGFSFWTFLKEGHATGEALRRAKIQVAREMHRRQGYLDGEDQKTLISFVLYGDPLAPSPLVSQSSRSVFRSAKSPAQVRVVCDRTADIRTYHPVPPQMLSYVKHVVSQYLPGMADAEVVLTQEHTDCGGAGHSCPTSQLGAKARPAHPPSRQVVTLSKQVQKSAFMHHHYARLTLDSQGKLVKLVVSR